jgi:hypothetical protein
MVLSTPVRIVGSIKKPCQKSAISGLFPPATSSAPLLPTGLYVALDLVELLLERYRPRLRLLVERVVELDGVGLFRQPLDQLVVEPLLHKSLEPAMHVWPVAAKMRGTAPFAATSTSGSSKSMFGDWSIPRPQARNVPYAVCTYE